MKKKTKTVQKKTNSEKKTKKIKNKKVVKQKIVDNKWEEYVFWRPTKYKKEYPKMLIEFFQSYIDDMYETHVVENASAWRVVKTVIRKPKLLPTIVDFAMKIWVDYLTLYRWATQRNENWEIKYPDFCKAYANSLTLQKIFIEKISLSWDANSSFAKFLLVNDHWKVSDAMNIIIWDESWKKEKKVDPRDMLEEEIDAEIQKYL